jgi:hypothetical protein
VVSELGSFSNRPRTIRDNSESIEKYIVKGNVPKKFKPNIF